MELFELVDYVLLQSPVHGTYIHAAEDGKSVHLAAAPEISYNAVWAVERHYINHIGYVRLRGVYGRYLGASDTISSLFSWPWVAAVQSDFDKPEVKEIEWQVSTVRDGTVELKSAAGPFLRTGLYFSGCRTTREWKVYAVPQTSDMPRPPSPCVDMWSRCFKREINWVLANREGEIEENGWGRFLFVGRDKAELEKQFNEETENFPLSMFVQAGSKAALTPLYVNLPRSREPLDIVGLWGTKATERLLFPRIDVHAIEMSKIVVNDWRPEVNIGSRR